MKRHLVAIAAVVTLTAQQAQAQYAPKQGDFSTEVQFNPFDQNGNTFSLESFRLRYFLTNKDAVRLDIGFSLSSHKVTADKDHDDNYSKSRNGHFNINFGYERHFFQSNRLDLYVGGQLCFRKNFAHYYKQTDDKNTMEYTNLDGYDNRASRTISAAAFTGLDFYVYKGLYVGTEIQFALGGTKQSETNKEIYVDGKKDDGDYKSKDNTRDFSAAFEITPVLRLGWRF